VINAVAAISLAAIFSSGASAQTDPGGGEPCCPPNYSVCQGDLEHKCQGPASYGFIGVHSDCLTCTVMGIPVDPAWCHDDCPELEEQPELMVLAYRRVLDAARAGDVNLLVKYAPAAYRYVSVNAARGAIQIKGCQADALIASVSVRDQRRLAALALELRVAATADAAEPRPLLNDDR
jgi:hypothetical protein